MTLNKRAVNYIARSLLGTGAFKPGHTLHCEEPVYRRFCTTRLVEHRIVGQLAALFELRIQQQDGQIIPPAVCRLRRASVHHRTPICAGSGGTSERILAQLDNFRLRRPLRIVSKPAHQLGQVGLRKRSLGIRTPRVITTCTRAGLSAFLSRSIAC